MGRVRRDHQDVEGFVEAGRQQRGVRAHVPDHEAHAGIDQLARRCHGLPEAAGVVGLDQPHLLAENAAARVQVLDCQRDRGTVAATRGRVWAAQGIGEADRDVGRDRSGQHARDDDGERAEMMLSHAPVSLCSGGGPPDVALAATWMFLVYLDMQRCPACCELAHMRSIFVKIEESACHGRRDRRPAGAPARSP